MPMLDMGDGKVPFSHQGFNKRMSQFPFRVRSAAENVAMNYGVSNVAQVFTYVMSIGADGNGRWQ